MNIARTLFRFTGLIFLYICAKIVLFIQHPQVIFIVGNVGKTTTKNALYGVLYEANISVSKTKKSINGFDGVLLSILDLTPPKIGMGWGSVFLAAIRRVFKHTYPHTIIVEVGVDNPKDMSRVIYYITRPDIVIATTFPPIPVHVANFKNVDDLYHEKAYAFEYVKKGIISNGDDILLQAHIKKRMPKDTFNITFCAEGIQQCEVQGSIPTVEYTNGGKVLGIRFEVRHKTERAIVSIANTIGDGAFHASLASLTLGITEYNIPITQIAKTLSSYSFLERGRATLRHGIKDTQILDDTYNASPYPTEKIIRTVGELTEPKRKILILGDLAELGEKEGEICRYLLEHLTGLFEIVFLVGSIGMYAPKKDHIYKVDTAEGVVRKLPDMLRTGDFILCKGSRRVELEKVVNAIVDTQNI